MGRGRGRTGSGMNGAPYGRSPGGGSTGGWGEYGPGRPSGPSMGMARNGQEKVEYQFLVPSTKTGIIIGKGMFVDRQRELSTKSFNGFLFLFFLLSFI